MNIAERQTFLGKLFNKLVEKHALTGYELILSTSINEGSASNKDTFGTCNFVNKVISLSRRHVEEDEFEVVEDTLRHELAHALDAKIRGYSNHDKHWRKCARIMGATPRAKHKIFGDEAKKRFIDNEDFKWVIAHSETGQVGKAYIRRPSRKIVERIPYMGFKNNPRSNGMLKLFSREEYIKKWC